MNTAVLMMSFPVYEGIVCSSPVVTAKVTLGECLHKLHVKYLTHIEPDVYTFSDLDYDLCLHVYVDVCLTLFNSGLFMCLLVLYPNPLIV